MTYSFKSAETENLSDVFALYEQRVHWMDRIGLKQWNVTDYLNAYPISYYRDLQKQGNLYVLKSDQQIVGALALLNDDELWSDTETVSAYYIHHLVSDMRYPGVGKQMLEQAEKIAAIEHKECLRLDCAVDNQALNAYYQRLGFVWVKTCEDGPYRGNCLEKRLKLSRF